MIRCQSAITSFLWSLRSGHIKLAREEPPLHGDDAARPAPAGGMDGVPAGHAGSVDRRLLLSLVQSDGWSWQAINRCDSDDDALERQTRQNTD